MKNIIFDMDGVLVDSWDATNDAFLKLRYRGETLDEVIAGHIQYCSTKPYHAKGEHLSDERYKSVLKVLEDMYWIVSKDNRYKAFSGFLREIEYIQNARFAIVSSNSDLHVNNFLKFTGINFTYALSFRDSPSKEAKIETILYNWGVSKNEFIYITDTLADVYELETFMPKSNIYGCAWGYCGYDLLSKELPSRQILREFSDIHKILENI